MLTCLEKKREKRNDWRNLNVSTYVNFHFLPYAFTHYNIHSILKRCRDAPDGQTATDVKRYPTIYVW